MSMLEYDVVVVGGGPAGSMAAKYAAKEGVSTLIIEEDAEVPDIKVPKVTKQHSPAVAKEGKFAEEAKVHKQDDPAIVKGGKFAEEAEVHMP